MSGGGADMTRIYADNNATTAPAPEAVEAMLPFLRDRFYNPSSPYAGAGDVAGALKAARSAVAALIGAADPADIIFTSGATEANTTALRGAARARPARRHIVTTAVEHPAVLEVCRDMQRDGFEVDFLPVGPDGGLDLRDLAQVLRPDTLLVSVMHANNETGVVFPLPEIARIVRETDPTILVHSDATQAAGKIPIDMSAWGIDLLSMSGHKLHAPKGVGALAVRRGASVRPLLIGGHQENGRRAGTENVASIVALGRACELARDHLPDAGRMTAMRDRLETELRDRIPHIEINGGGAARLPNTLNVACHYIEGESILNELDTQGICASSGSACTSGSLEPSHVLRAMRVPFTAVHGSIRFSFSRYTTDREIDRIIEVFPGIVRALRRISPYWDAAADRPRPDAPPMTREP